MHALISVTDRCYLIQSVKLVKLLRKTRLVNMAAISLHTRWGFSMILYIFGAQCGLLNKLQIVQIIHFWKVDI